MSKPSVPHEVVPKIVAQSGSKMLVMVRNKEEGLRMQKLVNEQNRKKLELAKSVHAERGNASSEAAQNKTPTSSHRSDLEDEEISDDMLSMLTENEEFIMDDETLNLASRVNGIDDAEIDFANSLEPMEKVVEEKKVVREAWNAESVAENEKQKEVNRPNTSSIKNDLNFIVSIGINESSAHYESVRNWIEDIESVTTGNGRMRTIISPSVRSRMFLSPIGFGIGVFSNAHENNSLSLPMDVFDPYRLYMGVYAVRVRAKTEEGKSFYTAVGSVTTSEMREIVNRFRDEADFKLTESFIGIFTERSSRTEWEEYYWIVVRDGDTSASEQLYTFLEERHGTPLTSLFSAGEVEATKAAARSHRKRLAQRLFCAVTDTPESIDPGKYFELETDTVCNGIFMIKKENAIVVTNGMVPVVNEERVVLVSHFADGISVLEGEDNAGVWSASNLPLCLFPATTGSKKKVTDGSRLCNISGRIDYPDDYVYDRHRNSVWKETEVQYGRNYKMQERSLGPLFIAYSKFTGHSLENSEYSKF